MKKKNISNEEMFNSCDLNDNQEINIEEVLKFIEGNLDYF